MADSESRNFLSKLIGVAGAASLTKIVPVVPERLYMAVIDPDNFRLLPHGSFFAPDTFPRVNTHRHTDTKVPECTGNFILPEGEQSYKYPIAFIEPSKALQYSPLGSDFGPLDSVTTCRYFRFLNSRKSRVIVHLIPKIKKRKFDKGSCGKPSQLLANTAVLLAAHAIFFHKVLPSSIPPLFAHLPLAPFKDAYGGSNFRLDLAAVVEGLAAAQANRWFDPIKFPVEETEIEQSVEGGDMNWLIPGKFLAFAGPGSEGLDEDGLSVLKPRHYFQIFKKKNVTDIVRLNAAMYDQVEFTGQGFQHHELCFADGSCPSDSVVEKFLVIANNAKGAVAVHCKAGLGRTATLCAIWAMRNFQISAKGIIGWFRIARPGSVLGPQQHFLVEQELKMKKLKDLAITSATSQSSVELPIFKIRRSRTEENLGLIRRGRISRSNSAEELSTRSSEDEEDVLEKARRLGSGSPIGRDGDAGQGNWLIAKKRRTAEKENLN